MKHFTKIVLTTLFVSPFAFAEDNIVVKIDDLTNVNGASAMEACGTAKHKDGIRPLWVTVKHDQSEYSTLTSPSDNFCVLIKRWTFNGETNATAQVLPTPQPQSK